MITACVPIGPYPDLPGVSVGRRARGGRDRDRPDGLCATASRADPGAGVVEAPDHVVHKAWHRYRSAPGAALRRKGTFRPPDAWREQRK